MSKQILRESLAVRRLLAVNPSELKDDVVAINRVTKVVKGGKNLSFSALVVVGDNHGHAGFGMGKAREVPMAMSAALLSLKVTAQVAETRSKPVDEISGRPCKEKAAATESN